MKTEQHIELNEWIQDSILPIKFFFLILIEKIWQTFDCWHSFLSSNDSTNADKIFQINLQIL